MRKHIEEALNDLYQKVSQMERRLARLQQVMQQLARWAEAREKGGYMDDGKRIGGGRTDG